MGRAEAAIVSKALRKCLNLFSVRCVNRVVEYETALPWQGLRDMAHDTLHSSGRCLGHLAMEGCNLASDNIASLGLCGALNDFPRMRTLNLVRVGLDDQIIKFVSLSLGSTGDCLEWLDLTGNQIGTVGAKSLACLARTPKIAKRLQYLSLENNQIDKAGAVELLDAFGRIGSNEFDLNLKGNPCDMGAVALEIAASQCYTEQQNIDLLKGRDDLRNDIQQAQKNAQNLIARQAEMKRNLSTFREEVEKLKDDRDTLVKAFKIMGSLEQVEEHRKILNRLAALEQMVFVAPSLQICGQTYTEPSVKDIVSLDHSGRSATSASTAPCNPKSISLSSSLSPSPLESPRRSGGTNVLLKATSERWGNMLKAQPTPCIVLSTNRRKFAMNLNKQRSLSYRANSRDRETSR